MIVEVWQYSIYGMGLGDTVRIFCSRRCRLFPPLSGKGIGNMCPYLEMLAALAVEQGGITKVTFCPYYGDEGFFLM